MKRFLALACSLALSVAAWSADETPSAPPVFAEYQVTVEGLGTVTVIAPEGEPGYRVRLADGRVTAYPAHSGEPSQANAAADIAYALAHPTPPAVGPWRVLKDTIILRVKAAGKLTELAALVAALPADQKFEFDQSAWFSSDNPNLRGAAAALGLDPAVILAPDPLAP